MADKLFSVGLDVVCQSQHYYGVPPAGVQHHC